MSQIAADKKSITIVVPALNEEANLREAVRTVDAAAGRWFDAYEIFVFNDGSADRTGQIADQLAAEYPNVVAMHHDRPRGLGAVVRSGYARAQMAYVVWFCGKNSTSGEAMDLIYAEVGKADLVIPYAVNSRERPLPRRVLSWLFRSILNVIFRMDLKYFNHSVLCKASLARSVSVATDSHAFQAEVLIKLIRSGCTYVQVGIVDRFEFEGRSTKAFRFHNLIGVSKFVCRAFWDVYVRRRF